MRAPTRTTRMTLRSSRPLAMAKRAGVELPIAHAVFSILYEGLDPRDAIAKLMSRELKDETVG